MTKYTPGQWTFGCTWVEIYAIMSIARQNKAKGGEMKTKEAMGKYLAGKRYTYTSKRKRELMLNRFAVFSPEWPTTPEPINKWLNSLGVGQNAAATYLSQLRSMGDYLERVYDIPNPCKKVEKIKWEKKKRRYLTPDEEMLVIGACAWGYDRELVLTLASSLCRVGELGFERHDPRHNPGLRGKDVLDGYINVKGKTGERKYKLDRRLCEALRQMAGTPDGYVFKDKNGEPSTGDALKERVRRVFLRAGIGGNKLGAHTLRHSGASLIAKATNGNVLAVKGMLQHDDIKTTMMYIHDAEEVVTENIDVLKLLRDAATKPIIQAKQLELTEKTGGAETTKALALYGQAQLEVKESTLEQEAFPAIEENISTRPLLKTEDLQLIRRMAVVCFNTDVGKSDAMKARALLRRMLRKTGKGVTENGL